MAENRFENLSRFAVNLNERAAQGKLDPVIGRDDEIRRVLQILSRRTKNNPILVGEPGVGKTAVVEGLAQRILALDGKINSRNTQTQRQQDARHVAADQQRADGHTGRRGDRVEQHVLARRNDDALNGRGNGNGDGIVRVVAFLDHRRDQHRADGGHVSRRRAGHAAKQHTDDELFGDRRQPFEFCVLIGGIKGQHKQNIQKNRNRKLHSRPHFLSSGDRSPPAARAE